MARDWGLDFPVAVKIAAGKVCTDRNPRDLSARAACIDSVYDEVHDALTARSVMAKAQSTEIARR